MALLAVSMFSARSAVTWNCRQAAFLETGARGTAGALLLADEREDILRVLDRKRGEEEEEEEEDAKAKDEDTIL